MINRRSTLIVILFLVLSIVVFFIALDVKNKKEAYSDLLDVNLVDESIFEQMNYYSISEGKKYLNLTSEKLKVINQNDFQFTTTEGEIYNQKGEITTFKANSGEYFAEVKKLSLNEDIEFKADDAFYSADKLSLSQVQDYLSAEGDVRAEMYDSQTKDKIVILSSSMTSELESKIIQFDGNIRGVLERQRKYEGGFKFTSEHMSLNQLESQILLSKDVNLKRNNYEVEAQKAEIFLENYNKRLKYYVLYDDIKFVEKLKLKSGASSTRRAFSEKMEGYMSQGKIILSGAPRVEQGDDLIKGYQITLRENVELVEVDDSQSSFQLKKE